jgi:hypothetical protein
MIEGVKKDLGECWKRGAQVDVANKKKRLFMLSDKQVMGMMACMDDWGHWPGLQACWEGHWVHQEGCRTCWNDIRYIRMT